jgi:hypothetical protein
LLESRFASVDRTEFPTLAKLPAGNQFDDDKPTAHFDLVRPFTRQNAERSRETGRQEIMPKD